MTRALRWRGALAVSVLSPIAVVLALSPELRLCAGAVPVVALFLALQAARNIPGSPRLALAAISLNGSCLTAWAAIVLSQEAILLWNQLVT